MLTEPARNVIGEADVVSSSEILKNIDAITRWPAVKRAFALEWSEISGGATWPKPRRPPRSGVFFISGIGMAAWAPLVPFAKARAQIEDGMLGLLLLSLGTGSIIAMPVAGALRQNLDARIQQISTRIARTIEVKGAKAKTRQRRIVTIFDTLAEWLA